MSFTSVATNRPGNIEFKLYDIGIRGTKHFAGSLTDKWNVGRNDAKKSHQPGIDDFCGMFLRPYIGSSRDAKVYEPNLKQLLPVIWETLEPAALAWWCPVQDVLDSDRKTKNLILGAIMVVTSI